MRRAPRAPARPAPAARARLSAAACAADCRRDRRRSGTQPTTGQPGATAPAPYSSMVPSQNDGTVMPTIESTRKRTSAAGERSVAISAAQRASPAPARPPSAEQRQLQRHAGTRPAISSAPAGRSRCWCRNRRAARGRSRSRTARTNERSRPSCGAARRSRSGVTSARAQHELRGVAGHQPDHQERQHGHAEGDEQQVRRARSEDGADHAAPPSGSVRRSLRDLGLPERAQRARRRSARSPARRSRTAENSVP